VHAAREARLPAAAPRAKARQVGCAHLPHHLSSGERERVLRQMPAKTAPIQGCWEYICCTGRGSASAGFGQAILACIRSPHFLRPKPDLLPAKAVVMPSQAGSNCLPFALSSMLSDALARLTCNRSIAVSDFFPIK
jgi:hypothetical protein